MFGMMGGDLMEHGKTTKCTEKVFFTWPDGRSYEGDYTNDKKEGFGQFIW